MVEPLKAHLCSTFDTHMDTDGAFCPYSSYLSSTLRDVFSCLTVLRCLQRSLRFAYFSIDAEASENRVWLSGSSPGLMSQKMSDRPPHVMENHYFIFKSFIFGMVIVHVFILIRLTLFYNLE